MIKWEKCEYIAPQHELKTYPMWVGVDLAHKIDICAAAKLWRTDNGHVHADFKFWLPEGRLERCSRQQAELYRKWAEMDKLILTDGDVIDHAQIKVTYWHGLAVKTSGTGFDPWSAMQFSLALAEEGYRWWRFRRRSATVRGHEGNGITGLCRAFPSQQSSGHELDDV